MSCPYYYSFKLLIISLYSRWLEFSRRAGELSSTAVELSFMTE